LELSDRKQPESGGHLHNEELHNFYSSDISRVIKSRRVRWEGRISRRGKMRNAYRILVENLKGKDHFGNLGIYERIHFSN
jgi:hypothetical protein